MISKQHRQKVRCVYDEGGCEETKKVCPSDSITCFLLALSFFILSALFYPILATSQSVHAEGDSATVQISGPLQPPGFSPALLTIHVNDYVIFTNQSSPAATYSVAANDGSFSSPAIAPGKQWTLALNSPGEYEYHAISSPKRMVGEILVVANSISLLPTPAPDIQATAITIIEAGKTPPDNLAVPTPTPPARQTRQISSLSGLWAAPLLPLVESIIILLCLATGVFFLVRFYRRRLQKRKEAEINDSPEPEATQAQTSPRQRWLPWLRKKKEDEDEDEEDDYAQG